MADEPFDPPVRGLSLRVARIARAKARFALEKSPASLLHCMD